MAEDLDARAQEVLRTVVREFIARGEPVGSAQLTATGNFEVSPATMRSVLAELEELGYLEKPHTSAGRIPTDQGYRFFVDSQLSLTEPEAREKELIQSGLVAPTGVEGRLVEASRLLHSLTQHAAVVLTPNPASLVLERVEFVRLRGDRVLAILVGQAGQVENKLLTLDFPLTQDELLQAGNYLNELFSAGASLEDARSRVLKEMEQERSAYDVLVSKALRLGAAATELGSSERVLIEGAGTFLDAREFSENVRRMKALFKELDDKHRLLALLDRVQQGQKMQIFIGAESEFSAQGDVSVIVSPYGSANSVLGTVGVIGPTRMNYQRVIPLVQFTAQAISGALTDPESGRR